MVLSVAASRSTVDIELVVCKRLRGIAIVAGIHLLQRLER